MPIAAVSESMHLAGIALTPGHLMNRAVVVFLISALALVGVSGNLDASPATHCNDTVISASNAHHAYHRLSDHELLHADGKEEQTTGDCFQHLCPLFLVAQAFPDPKVAAVAEDPVSIGKCVVCLSRPESLYRPPNV